MLLYLSRRPVSEKGSNKKDGVDQIQRGRMRTMKCVNLVKRWRASDDTRRGKRQEGIDKQRQEIAMGKSASKRLVLSPSELTTEGLVRRPRIGSQRRRRNRCAGKPHAMVRTGRQT